MDLKRLLIMEGKSIGLDEMREGLAGVRREQEGVARGGERLGAGQERVSKTLANTERSADRAARSLDGLAKAEFQHERITMLIARAERDGIPVKESWLRAQEIAASRIRELSHAVNDNSREMGLNRDQVQESVHVVRAFVDEVAAGQSPLRALYIEGGRIAQVFTMGKGGVGGTLRDMASSLLGLLSPLKIVAGTIAAVSAVAVFSISRWREEQEALILSMNKLGRGSGISVEQATRLSNQAADRSGISQSAARGVAAQMLGAGVRGPALQQAIETVPALQHRTGMSFDEAAKELTDALADPAHGADELSRKYGVLTMAQRQEIETLVKMGERGEATTKLLEEFNKSLAEMQDITTYVGKAWEGFKKSISDFPEAFTRWFSRPVLSLQDEKRDQLFKEFFERRARTQEVRERTETAVPIIKRELPEIDQRRELEIRQQALNRALNTEGVQQALQNMGITSDQARASLEHLTGQLVNWQSATDRIAEDAKLTANEVLADTYAERELAVTERARIETLRETGDKTRALVSSEAQRLRLMAEAQKTVDDYIRRGARERSTLGLSPFKARQQQILNEAEEVRRNLPTEETKPVAFPKVMSDDESIIREIRERNLPASEETVNRLKREREAAAKGRLILPEEAALPRRVLSVEPVARERASETEVSTPRQLRKDFEKEVSARLKAQTKEDQESILRRENIELDNQLGLLAVQADSWGKTAGQVAAAAEKQKLYNEYFAQDIPISKEVTDGIEQAAIKAGALADAQERSTRAQQMLNQTLDEMRNIATGVMSSFVDDLVRGEKASHALRNALTQVLHTLEQIAIKKIGDLAFGESGKSSGEGAGGLIGGFLSKALENFKFAEGGIMSSHGPLPLMRYADGGVANTPQMAMFGEGRTPEAYVPLRDGRSIPVTMQGGAGAQKSSNQITVINQAGVSIEPKVTKGQVTIIVREMLNAYSAQLPNNMEEQRLRRNA